MAAITEIEADREPAGSNGGGVWVGKTELKMTRLAAGRQLDGHWTLKLHPSTLKSWTD